jgi:peptidoglycan hydrolase-like protein with peptidoglycan-binding domain
MMALFAMSAPAFAAGERLTGSVHGGMQEGLSNDHVRELQQALQAKGHNVGPIDGIMGPQTQSALRDFQRSQGFETTGRFDDRTRASLGLSAAASGSSALSPSGSPSGTLSPSTSSLGTPGSMGNRPDERQPGTGNRPEDRQPGTPRPDPMGSGTTGSGTTGSTAPTQPR